MQVSPLFRFQSFIILMVLLITLSGCSTGSDPAATTPNDPNNQTPGQVLQGVFFNIEGVQYSSGSESGLTGTAGAFSYEEGKNIQFFIGDILIGEAPTQGIVSIIDLVPNAQGETNETLRNIYRFLLSLDVNNTQLDKIKISQTVRDNAIGQSVDFTQSNINFEINETNLIATLIDNNDPQFTPRSSSDTLQGLRTNLLGLYSGFYAGNLNRDNIDTWSVNVDIDGNISGEVVASSNNSIFKLIAGQVNTDGSVEMKSNDTSGMRLYSDTENISRYGDIVGLWSNSMSGDNGVFSGIKTTAPLNDNSITSLDDLLDGVSIYNTVISNFSKYNSAEMNLKAPDTATNAAIVPVSIAFPSGVGSLWLFISSNTEKIVSRVDYIVANDNGLFQTRVRIKQSGDIIAIFHQSNGSILAFKKSIVITNGSVPREDTCTAACAQPITLNEVSYRSTMGVFKLRITYQTYVNDYLSAITLRFDGSAIARLYLSPMISDNPYFSLRHQIGSNLEVGVGITPVNRTSLFYGTYLTN